MHELGPIVTHLPLDTPEQVAKQKLGMAGKTSWSDFREGIERFDPDYLRTYFAIEQAESVMKSLAIDGADGFSLERSEYVGYKLICHRAASKVESLDVGSTFMERLAWKRNIEFLMTKAQRRSTKYE